MKKIMVLCAMLLLQSFTVYSSPIPDTGQAKCYDDVGTEIDPCPQAGESFYGQDAQYAPCNPHSYTKLDTNGNDLPDEATVWVMVRDNVTGLIWENKTDDDSIHDINNSYNWSDSQSVFIVTLNSQNFGGYSDWRLPTIQELSSLVDSSKLFPGPIIDTDYFPNTAYYIYWSSTADAYRPYYAWHVHFRDGGGVYSYHNYSNYFVRAVRGEEWGSNNFIDNGNGTITDTSTGLMWEVKTDDGGPRDKDNSYTWQQALSYCENLTLAEYSDWRLPNRNELQSIVDYSRYSTSIDFIFSYTIASAYWSSTTFPKYLDHACSVDFDGGGVYGGPKFSNYFVRAVRGGQCDLDSDGIQDDGDNSGIPDDNPCTGGQTESCDDNCLNDSNPNQEDADSDGAGDVCDNCPIIFNPTQMNSDTDSYGDDCDNCLGVDNEDQADEGDSDGTGNVCDNCPNHPNGTNAGTCVKIVGGVVMGTGFNCTGHGDCGESELCDMEQGDCNDNGVGDVCERYADATGDGKVDLNDLVILKQEFLRTDCNDPEPCYADCNGDGKVDLSDLVIMKAQFLQ